MKRTIAGLCAGVGMLALASTANAMTIAMPSAQIVPQLANAGQPGVTQVDWYYRNHHRYWHHPYYHHYYHHHAGVRVGPVVIR